MNATLRSWLPRGLWGWLLFAIVIYAYSAITIKVLLNAEVIHQEGTKTDWSILEKAVAFPAFYMGAEPITGLVLNAVLWGIGLTKIVTLLIDLFGKRIKV